MSKETKKVHNWLKHKPTFIGKILCKLFGHRLRVVGTIGEREEIYCAWCGKVIKGIKRRWIKNGRSLLRMFVIVTMLKEITLMLI